LAAEQFAVRRRCTIAEGGIVGVQVKADQTKQQVGLLGVAQAERSTGCVLAEVLSSGWR
jgi:hypothetical protein